MRTIGVVTVARSDYGILRPVMRAIEADSRLRLETYVSGMHLAPEFGETVEVIEDDGFEIDERVEMLLSSDTPTGLAKSTGLGVSGFAQVFGRRRPDVLLVLGDRFEMMAAVLAALPFNIPVAHIHGGEVTEAAIDDSIRHAVTKLSHFHFVATETYGRRIRQLGESPDRVVWSGAPGLDAIRRTDILEAEAFAETYGVEAGEYLLVTFHPVTLEYEDTGTHVDALIEALESAGRPCLVTMPNADTGGRHIRRRLQDFGADRPDVHTYDNLGTSGYFSAMAHAAAMVGNSSSGIIEAPSFELPVVNIGDRQKGRVRPGNIFDVVYGADDILAGIHRACSSSFAESLEGLENPYGDGHAANRIVETLSDVDLDGPILQKSFQDWEEPPS